jgi:hypothetical protein
MPALYSNSLLCTLSFDFPLKNEYNIRKAGRATGICEFFSRVTPRYFNSVDPNPDMNSWQFPLRSTSGEIYCLCLGRVYFYFPLLEIRGERIEMSLQYIANHPRISAGHKNRSIIRKCGGLYFVALGRIGWDNMAPCGTPYGIGGVAESVLLTEMWKERPLRKEAMIFVPISIRYH